MSLNAKLFRFNKWLGNVAWNKRYFCLMVRDQAGLERWERTQLMKLRRLSGQYSNWLLGIKNK